MGMLHSFPWDLSNISVQLLETIVLGTMKCGRKVRYYLLHSSCLTEEIELQSFSSLLLQWNHKTLLCEALQTGQGCSRVPANTDGCGSCHRRSHIENNALSLSFILLLPSLILVVPHLLLIPPYLGPISKSVWANTPFGKTFSQQTPKDEQDLLGTKEMKIMGKSEAPWWYLVSNSTPNTLSPMLCGRVSMTFI